MAKDPADRYSSAGALAAAAAEALGVTPVVPTTPSTPTGPVPTPPRRRTSWLIGAGAVVVAVVVLLVVVLNGGDGTGTAAGPSSAAAPKEYLARIDPTSGRVTARIPLGPDPIDVAVGEGSVWVLSSTGSVYRIDPVTQRVTVIRHVAQDPRAIAAGEGSIWVADGNRAVVQRIDPATNGVVEPIPMSGVTTDVTVGLGSAWAVNRLGITRITSGGSNETFLEYESPLAPFASGFIAVSDRDLWLGFVELDGLIPIDVDTAVEGDPVENGFGTHGLAAFGDAAWIVGCGTPGVAGRIDEGGDSTPISAGGSVCTYVGVVGTPMAIAAGPEGVWVTDTVNGTVSRIQSTTNQVQTPVSIGITPTAVAVGLGSVWVTIDGSVAGSPSASPSS
jgi:hypothetical protein